RLAGPGRGKTIRFAVSGACGLLALGSKENAATLPLFVALYEWFFFQDLSLAWVRDNARKLALAGAAGAVLAVVYLAGAGWANMVQDYEQHGFTMVQRVMTEWRVVVLYLSLFVFPHPSRLSVAHDIPLSHGLVTPPSTLAAALFLLALFAGAVALARRERFLSFAVLWLLGNLVVESSVIGLDLVFEHRMYLPMALLPPAAAVFLFRWVPKKTVAAAFLCVLIAVFGAWTIQRNAVWKSAEALWTDAVQKAPGLAVPHNNLAAAYYNQGRYALAAEQYNQTLALDPDNLLALYNLGVLYHQAGRPDLAADCLQKALAVQPGYMDALNELGVVYLDAGLLDKAEDTFRRALAINPDSAPAYANLGVVLMRMGRVKDAVQAEFEAIQIDPEYVDAQVNMAVTLIAWGRPADAEKHLRKALEIDPGNIRAKKNLGFLLLAHLGRPREAADLFLEILEADPGNRDALFGLKQVEKVTAG
ncbi:MAG: tetratricopeptide repeat protein, partial [Deltaproteobacteria bacterium]|nr:tetratricopeptide repeat protein [Deltaproteobacteria bacterium]